MSEVTKTLEKKKAAPIKKKADIKKEKNSDTTKSEKVSTDQEHEKDTPKTDSSSPAQNEKGKYFRGENQKPVTKAYRNNWNQIFSKTKK